MQFTRKSKRQAFAASRADSPDIDFLQQLAIQQESHHMALSLRRTIAKQCGIAPEKIRHDDSPRILAPLLSEFFDETCFILDIEQALGQSLNLDKQTLPLLFDLRFFWWKKTGATTFGEWIKEFIKSANNQILGTA